jgi:antitoxin YefM
LNKHKKPRVVGKITVFLAFLKNVRYNVHTYFYSGLAMTTLTATAARANFYGLIDEAAQSHEPIIITSKRHNVVMISEDDWRAITETLTLLSIPAMRESIRQGMEEPLEDCSKELNW